MPKLFSMGYTTSLISLFLILNLGCSSKTKYSNQRGPSQYENLESQDHWVYKKFTTIEQLNEFAISNPWTFTQANQYCDTTPLSKQLQYYMSENYPAFKTAKEVLDESFILNDIQKYILEINNWTFNQLACDQKYQKMLLAIAQEAANPTYKYNGELGFVVSAFPSMAFNSTVETKIKSIVEIPDFMKVFKNTSDSKQAVSSSLIESSSTQKTVHLVSEILSPDKGLCRHVYKTNEDQAYYDFVIANCFSLTPYAKVLSINEKKVLFYLHYDWAGGKNYFELKAHTIRKLNESDYNQEYIRNNSLQTASADPTVLALKLNKSVTNNADEIAVPVEFDVIQLQQDKYRFIYNVFDEAQSHIISSTFDSNFQNIQFEYKTPEFKDGYLNLVGTFRDQIMYAKSSFNGSQKLVTYNLTTFKTTEDSKVSVFSKSSKPFVTKIYLYPTKDGKKLPLTVSHAEGYTNFKASNFGIVESYGGFNIITPTIIGPDKKVIFKSGGFVATVSVRGGGEMGPKEWKSAFGVNRDVSSDDLNAATEFLIRKGYAQQKRIALRGGSNGGLLVLSAVMKKPELYGAVVSLSPVTSPIEFTSLSASSIFWGLSDYGDISDSKVRDYWKKKSPLNNLAKIKNLPPILLRTAYDDQNVHPTHSVNLFSELNKRPDSNRFLFYIMPNGYGHNPPNLRSMIEESSYQLSFLFRVFNVSM